MSFCGPNKGKYDSHHMNIEILKEIASSFCQCVIYLSKKTCPEYQMAMREIEQNLLQNNKEKEEKEDENPFNKP